MRDVSVNKASIFNNSATLLKVILLLSLAICCFYLALTLVQNEPQKNLMAIVWSLGALVYGVQFICFTKISTLTHTYLLLGVGEIATVVTVMLSSQLNRNLGISPVLALKTSSPILP